MKLLPGCLAALLLSVSGAAAAGQTPATDVPPFAAQGAFVAIVVTDLDAEATTKPDTAKLLRDGVANLDSAGGAKFADLSSDQQVAVLQKNENTPFFQKVHSTELVSLYNNHTVWKKLGYEGPSYQLGGYLHHGFNDLNWLPDPPALASP